MLRILPFILIPVLVLAGLGYWRFVLVNTSLESPKIEQNLDQAIEVPETLPGSSLEERVKTLEEAVLAVAKKINSSSPSPQTDNSLDTRLKAVEAANAELKIKVSNLEKASPQTTATSTSKSVVYIPLGSGGGPWANTDWYTTPEYEITLDPANYPGYSGMVLEVTFRLVEPAGTGSVRLYNASDNKAASSELTTTSGTFAVKSSSSFTLPSGSKTYKLQIKSTASKDLFIQSARIKVNF